jgi:malate/lactate dehydrogenase
MREVISKITQYNEKCILLMVTNPLDVMTFTALKLSDFSKTGDWERNSLGYS